MSQYPRSMAVSIKKAIVDTYSAGNELGFETAQRALWEIGETIAEIHGRKKAAEAIYRIADEIVAREYPNILIAAAPIVGDAVPEAKKHPGAGRFQSAAELPSNRTIYRSTIVYYGTMASFVAGQIFARFL